VREREREGGTTGHTPSGLSGGVSAGGLSPFPPPTPPCGQAAAAGWASPLLDPQSSQVPLPYGPHTCGDGPASGGLEDCAKGRALAQFYHQTARHIGGNCSHNDRVSSDGGQGRNVVAAHLQLLPDRLVPRPAPLAHRGQIADDLLE
jgi:hypothetical protein